MRIAFVAAIFLLASSTVGHSDQAPTSNRGCEPPEWSLPQNLSASVPAEMVSGFRVENYEVKLEDTSMEEARQHLGGEIRAQGDAANALQWLCLYGTDAVGGWVLWLESREIDAGYVGGFQWQRLSGNKVSRRGCHALRHSPLKVELALPLRLGATRPEG